MSTLNIHKYTLQLRVEDFENLLEERAKILSKSIKWEDPHTIIQKSCKEKT